VMAKKKRKIRRTSIRSTAASPDSRETSAVAAPATNSPSCRQASFHYGPMKYEMGPFSRIREHNLYGRKYITEKFDLATD
jgi:hypothetical protein